MSFIDSGLTGHNNPFGGTDIAPGGFGAPSGFGGGESKLTGTNAPGTVSPFDQQAVGNALNLNEQAMANRYGQLGLSGQGATPTSPGGPAGGITGPLGNVTSGPGGISLAGTNQSAMPTAEQMDLGMLPSLSGGLPGEAEALLGQIQNNNLQAAGGSGGGGKGGMGGMGSMLGSVGKAAMMGGK